MPTLAPALAPLLLLLANAQDQEPMARYLADLEKAGVLADVDAQRPATVESLRETLVQAENELVTGNTQIAAARLFRVVESPRFAKLSYAPEYANAELTLGRALVRAGG